MDVLVAYATKNGSTREVAEAIAAALHEHAAGVELRPASQARESPAGRDLVVLGGALYSGRWHRDAHRFLKRHRRELTAGVPLAVFGMGPRTGDEEAWRRSRAQLDRALAKRSWVNPVAVAVFGGVDPPGRTKRERRDMRDWDAIRDWARQVLEQARRRAEPGGPPRSRPADG
ncbi:flavodoxin domain-containing protein [Amycolatopsis mongoliensis]|uniref:Flavodoxin domain-containing protein n=1 Tax=Amycolatopsis mongoliensis TaxID=715475 RepID=A0A9Y2JHC1_9PSEU|nr:flavodoxin domain-containing protein [Amycolatopsis sp. 4-36]WIX98519.1 flavodoxin domain-containing protein [Amycolatopsis sp. 4-36]